MKAWFGWLAAIAVLAAASVARATTLEIDIVGMASDGGDVHVALYDTPENFPKSGGMAFEARVPVSGGRAKARFADLAPGRYAVAVYHDANDNDDFDQGVFGIPLEDFGFSSGARAFLGPPGFEDAAFDVPASGTRIVIRLDD